MLQLLQSDGENGRHSAEFLARPCHSTSLSTFLHDDSRNFTTVIAVSRWPDSLLAKTSLNSCSSPIRGTPSRCNLVFRGTSSRVSRDLIAQTDHQTGCIALRIGLLQLLGGALDFGGTTYTHSKSFGRVFTAPVSRTYSTRAAEELSTYKEKNRSLLPPLSTLTADYGGERWDSRALNQIRAASEPW